jgi:hypothetical protein
MFRGITYIQIDSLEEGEEKTITLPLKNDTSYETEELFSSIVEKGLTEEEARELINQWKIWWFYPTNSGVYTRLIYMIPQSIYDRLLPLTIVPPPTSITRVGIVTITDIPLFNNISVTLATDKLLYYANESVNVSMWVTNEGEEDIILTFPDAQVADFEILNEDGERVYLWSSDKTFIQVITQVRVPAKGSVELLSETWRIYTLGNYTLRGWLPLTPRIYSNTVGIEVLTAP